MPYLVLLELDTPSSQIAVKELSEDQLKSHPSILPYSPHRVVPFLVLPDGSSILESLAITLYICETFDTENKIHPPPGHPNRLLFLQGVVFSVVEGYKALMACFIFCSRIEKEKRNMDKLIPAREQFHKIFIAHLVKALDNGKKTYYLGDEYSAADAMMAYILMGAEYCDCGMIDNEVVEKYFANLKARPSYVKAFAP